MGEDQRRLEEFPRLPALRGDEEGDDGGDDEDDDHRVLDLGEEAHQKVKAFSGSRSTFLPYFWRGLLQLRLVEALLRVGVKVF